MSDVPHVPPFLRRKDAGAYLHNNFGFGSFKTLGRLASQGGGPEFHKTKGGAAIYRPAKLDEWAFAQIGEAQISTADIPPKGRPPGRPPSPQSKSPNEKSRREPPDRARSTHAAGTARNARCFE
jgi:hypothetical protein